MADKWRVQNSWGDTDGHKVGLLCQNFLGIVVACGSVPDSESRGPGLEPQCLHVASRRMRLVRWWLINGGYRTPGEILMAIKVGHSRRVNLRVFCGLTSQSRTFQ